MKAEKIDICEFRKQHDFVEAMSDAVVSKFIWGIDRISYEIFEVGDGDIYEFVCSYCDGRLINARNVTADSLIAIYDEIGVLVRGGNYGDKETYSKVKECSLRGGYKPQ